MPFIKRLIVTAGAAAVTCACLPSAFACTTDSYYGVICSTNSSNYGNALAPAGAAQAAAIADFQNQVLDTTVQQKQKGEDQESALPGEFPTGRLRETWHDGYKALSPGQEGTPGFRTAEGSAFASGFYKLPGSFLGGQLQIGGFVGYDQLFVAYAAAGGKADNELALFGGYGLYTAGPNYLMATVAGAEGATNQSNITATTYGTNGVFMSAVGGHVQDLSPTLPVKLDLRGGISYMEADGDTYLDSGGNALSTSVNGWSGSLSATLFTDIPASGGAVMRPYIKGEVREQFSYNNTVEDLTADTAFGYGQAATTGALEAGLDYTLPGITINGAVYGEAASDRATVGTKLGAKFKLN